MSEVVQSGVEDENDEGDEADETDETCPVADCGGILEFDARPVCCTEGHVFRRAPAIAPPKPGRNAPCPCGSGRKFKRCCLARASSVSIRPLPLLVERDDPPPVECEACGGTVWVREEGEVVSENETCSACGLRVCGGFSVGGSDEMGLYGLCDACEEAREEWATNKRRAEEGCTHKGYCDECGCPCEGCWFGGECEADADDPLGWRAWLRASGGNQ